MKYHIKPWKHQQDTIDKCQKKAFYGLFFEVGTGKSLVAVNVARHKYAKHQKVFPTLIFAPISVLENWKKEWIISGGKFYSDKVEVIYGTAQKKLKLIESPKPIKVINYDSLVNKDIISAIKNFAPKLLICDESHMLKNFKSKRTKAIMELSKEIPYRFILTGTPVLNSIEDLWSQMYILQPNILGNNFYAFKNRYMVDKNAAWKAKGGAKYFPNWEARDGAKANLHKIVSQYADYVNKDECLDLPPLVYTDTHAALTIEQERMYKQMKNEFITYLEDKACIARVAMSKGLRLQQLMCGIFVTDDNEVKRIRTKRIDVLKETLESISKHHKSIVWTIFKPTYGDIEKVCSDLDIECTLLTGEQSLKEKEANMQRFREDPGCRVLISNPAAGGTGVNLIEASYSIYYSRGFNLAHYLQSQARNYRGGSEMHKKITQINIVTPNTIDERIMSALKNKQDLGDMILKNEFKEMLC